MTRCVSFALAIGLLVAGLTDVHAEERAHPFEMPASLVPVVGFWVRVYSEWDTTQVALHDNAQVDVVYRVLDLSELELRDNDSTLTRQAKSAARLEAVQHAREDIEQALLSLAEKKPERVRGLRGTEREVYLAWEPYADNPERFAQAARRVRAQRGIADRFAYGYRMSGRFMGAIQEQLRAAGHPEGLVALAFTESLMTLHARSSSGAVGPWQFLKGTGKEYMAINDVVDERKDPILSTLAAARYLNNSKERLGSWGAAITAYNYGTNGMARAVKQLGTSDIEVILAEYETSRFGFAAKNYYAEFLASLHVISHADRYFQGIKPVAPWSFDAVVLPREVKASELWAAGVDKADLSELNPALTPSALRGTVALPKGLTLRVPASRGKTLLKKLGTSEDAPVKMRTVTLRRGQTLMTLVRRYGVSLGELCAANGIDPHDTVHPGQRFKIPISTVGFTRLPEAAEAARRRDAVTVTFSRPQGLDRHAALLAHRRPGPTPVVVAYGGNRSTPARKEKPEPEVLVSTAPVEEDKDESAVVLFAADPESLGPPTMITVPRGQGARVIAGPAVEVGSDAPMDAVDIFTGVTELPEVDMRTSGNSAQDGTPLEVLPVPSWRTGPES